ncbi:uncharacterized protein A4U43_C08F19290 [Asparagus officinalis]|nr:uncharacterized protein A4U43_C08F19290 [Asparagus officinalis]
MDTAATVDSKGGDELTRSRDHQDSTFDVSSNVWEISIPGPYLYRNNTYIFPPEAENFIELEGLQVKFLTRGLSKVSSKKLWCLMELNLFRVPRRPRALSVLGESVSFRWLTKLSICHFSLRCLPPEVGCLKKLEELELSFNKMKDLSNDICELHHLKLLRVTNNKLVDLPSGISSLGRLEKLDLSNNRLTSLSQLELASMRTLQYLNLQDNKLHFSFDIPSWICCKLGGNEGDISKWRVDDRCDIMVVKMDDENDSHKYTILGNGRSKLHLNYEERLVDHPAEDKFSHGANGVVDVSARVVPSLDDNGNIGLTNISYGDNSSCITESNFLNTENDYEDESVSSCLLPCPQNELTVSDDNSSSDTDKRIVKSKRHSDKDLDNPKPSKFRRAFDDYSYASCKYSTDSFCSIDDYLPDGFYDAGRDRLFMSLDEYERSLCLDSREVILLDRHRDEELDAIASSAQMLLSSFRRSCSRENKDHEVDNLQRASILAMFVSDCFGGSDRSSTIIKLRRTMVGSNKQQPFICTCWAGNVHGKGDIDKQGFGMGTNFNFEELCDNSLRLIKARRNSIVVPIGTLRFGVCRHRAVLMKYLCDRADPPIPCELVRGFLDYMPHAWNAIHVKKGNSFVRMIVDACHPADIREETDPEYYCRYFPLCRVQLPSPAENSSYFGCSFSFPSLSREIEKAKSQSVFHCKFGTIDAAVKVRNLESCRASLEEIRNFEYSFLGEVRMLGALRKHSSIVEIYGHQLSYKWAPSVEGVKENRLLQSLIVMEYIKGGSVKLLERGEKNAPVDIALFIARDVACALVELHSKNIIHRDIKSENILIDLDRKRSDGTPVIKLADFDRSVPLQSFMHTCCNAHIGIHPPDVCVGTPRWMAPEVLQAMHQKNHYGLEVDIWSYGCLLYELLTLQIPYSGLSDDEIYNLLQMKRRPRLTPELESLALFDEPDAESDADAETLKLLIDLFYECTSSEPTDRPTAQYIYDKLDEVSRQPGTAQIRVSSNGSSS